eukprot:2804901-Amphidinium_carterae.1
MGRQLHNTRTPSEKQRQEAEQEAIKHFTAKAEKHVMHMSYCQKPSFLDFRYALFAVTLPADSTHLGVSGFGDLW